MESKKNLNNKWILWYHDPLDTNWDLSVKNLHEINSHTNFGKYINLWTIILLKIACYF